MGDAAVDGFQVAVALAGLGGDAAVDLVDVLAGGERRRARRGRGRCERQAVHVRLRDMAGTLADAWKARLSGR